MAEAAVAAEDEAAAAAAKLAKAGEKASGKIGRTIPKDAVAAGRTRPLSENLEVVVDLMVGRCRFTPG
jgi:hypothetical protein